MYAKLREYRDDPNYGEYHDDRDDSCISGLTEQISSNIFKISSGANAVERATKSIGTEKDSLQLRDKIHETSQNTNKIVQTTTRLLHLVANKRTNKQQKVQLDLLKSQFQEAVQRFQTLQKRAAETVKTLKLKSHSTQQPLISFDGDTDQGQAFNVKQQQMQVLEDQATAIEDDLVLIQEREERIRQLESDILNVNEIFRDLGALVHTQGEVIDTIDSNVERASTNVELGNQELVKAAVYQSKSRKKICCLVVTFLVIAIIITIITVVAVKT